MVSKSSDSASKLKRGGEQSGDGIGKSLYQKMYQLKAQIQADRAISVKERVERNKKKLEADVSHLLSSSRKNESLTGRSGAGELVSFRAGSPVIQYSGFPQGSGERDHLNGHEVAPPMSIKLPFVEKIPPYTTWIFLDRNQRMTEDQSVVGRRRIYYDQHGSEALICSDSEEELVEHEEEKHEFSEGEDRFVWTVFQEYGLAEEVLNSVSQFIGVPTSEVQERCDVLKEKYSKEQNAKDCTDPGFESGICLDKSLSAALDSFDNLFCRRCMVFDCRLHGCSQTLINPSEKQSYWSEYEDDRNPCGDQCCLHLRVVKDKSVHPVDCALEGKTTATLEERDATMAQGKEEQSGVEGIAGPMESEILISDKEMPVTSESVSDPELAVSFLNFDRPTLGIHDEHNKKRKSPQDIGLSLDDKMQDPDDMNDSSCKKLKKLTLDVVAEAVDNLSSLDHSSSFKSEADNNDLYMNAKNTDNCSNEHALKELTCGKENMGEKAKDVTEEHEPNQPSLLEKQQGRISSLSEWRPIEKELYLKGVEIFGKNSCLIARNLLSGLKTCVEVYNYMCNSGATLSHRSVASSSFLQESGKADTDYVEQEMPTRSRLLRRRGRTRKLKYSWKSAGHPSMWKRIADGKNQYYKQYTPCGCQSMCGKQCPCLNNGTCCEKYCGCSKSCKNRFRGCHCAKSQCRSRQCPCFAAGRECDPDVCRNCWVSCGDGSLGEPLKQGDGQCGNMRLLLRQQQRILLAKSDVAGWGAFLKNSVNKNDYLGEYTGELISHREADKRGKIYDRANSSFLFDLNDQYVLDAYRKGDKLKFANHSSNPNCYAKVMLVAGDHRVGIFAKEHIEASEELFYDYRYGPDQAPAWARKPEGSKRDDSTVSQGRAKKHHSHS